MRTSVRTAVIAAGMSALLAAPAGALAAQKFNDVPADSLYAGAVERLTAAGVIKGCAADQYCPADQVTRGQLALLLDRLSGNGDVAPSVDAATVMGLRPDQLSAGLMGPAGPVGPEGVAGPAGAPGAQGVPGLQGLNGEDGTPGEGGAEGAQGAQGGIGPAGAQGLTGATGASGPAGEQGPAGDQGAAGEQGPAGPTGAVGPAGPGTVGSVYTVDDGYLVLDSGNGNEMILTCNYGRPSSQNETFWFSSATAPAATVLETFNGGGVAGVYSFSSIAYGGGGTNRVNPNGWPYQATVTLNEGGALSRWDVTVAGSQGGPCTFTVYQSGPGSIYKMEPR